MILGKLISVLEAEQDDGKAKQRNDRLIAIPIEVASREPMPPVVELSGSLKKTISEFFVHYNQLQGRKFRPIRYGGASCAIRLACKSFLAS